VAITAQLPVAATANGQNTYILVANTFDSTVSTVLVIYHDGMGESETSIVTDSLKATTIQALVDAGCIVASSNSHGDSCGNQDSLDDYVALYDYVVARWKVSGVLHLSQSMGGLSGLLCYAQDLVPNARGWAGIYPACSLSNFAGSFPVATRTAYGYQEDYSDYPELTAGHDPVLLSTSVWNGRRLISWASASDGLVPKAANTDVLAGRATGAAEMTVITATGNHGDPSHFDPPRLLEFMVDAGLNV
jgi:hypothetical protein